MKHPLFQTLLFLQSQCIYLFMFQTKIEHLLLPALPFLQSQRIYCFKFQKNVAPTFASLVFFLQSCFFYSLNVYIVSSSKITEHPLLPASSTRLMNPSKCRCEWGAKNSPPFPRHQAPASGKGTTSGDTSTHPWDVGMNSAPWGASTAKD